jgi:prevent-host-death family protein
MAASRLTVTDVNQNFSRARRAVLDGPVIITERGEPALVLMTWESFRAREALRPTLLERLDVPGTEDIDFEPQRSAAPFRPADLD